ncbi:MULTISPECIES: glycosyltransferase family 39 protein [unclassified Mucilaginibacter]|uniref:ArnT family glycosyltransferase n=1 Tax=unclassified Mucilaginibacter TaxID=2617802 RepID=UPI002AC8CC9F|nr:MULTISPECIES: glycosyltransferase family 39 protein [unclassified Mucilaginibacter]MEB0263534.1 glycosyltransferase family 39 protein [Mucilaginibacter sp. 10I4]MEB0277740.1 glycosyltransferase family 39 protein [Mucilaginibacter sp. 10B2]MEB0302781.1 glycosyltransferase family 39 protein [Mucilaginibacter sp. 5C4]WPX24635.1 glycosyltransferase family 39 protein [Mucilaginibacter sp. 5C4]
MQQPDRDNYKWLYTFIGLAVLLNFTGLFIPILAPDGTLYAAIAKTMVQRNDYVNIIVNHTDWLDKPHFPFWVAALSFKIFGFTTWAYKLPGILFMLMGAWYTYKLAKELYTKQIALWAVLVLLTSQHIILSNNDVRAEPYLTGLIIASVYYFYIAYTRNKFWQLVLGALFAACAIMTKGMFALVPIGGAIVCQLAITKQWKQLFNLRWLLAAALILVFILPEIWCLYVQFDSHPEKLVFDTHNVSGIKFFFWDSQFGRFFNTGPIKGHGDPSFFVHTTLWAFLPWSLILFAAIWHFIKTGIKDVQKREWLCISGALLTFLLFSASKFQLPHYLNIVFPFFAIITAQYLVGLQSERTIKTIRIMQIGLVVLLLLVIGTLHCFFKPQEFNWHVGFTLLIWLALLIILPGNFSDADFRQTAFRTLIIAFVVNLYLNLAFYPSLLKYQAGSEAAFWINQNNAAKLPVARSFEFASFPMEFYLQQPIVELNEDGSGKIPATPFIFYGPAEVAASFTSKGYKVEKLAQFQRFHTSRLTPKFLNQATRDKEVVKMEVVKVFK